MKRKIRLSSGIIGGPDMLSLVEILPQLKESFRQRKEFFEYYFDETEVTLSLEDIDKLSNDFEITIRYEELIIQL